jgi:DNA-binding HxlR family transcriptional regulator
MSKRSYAQYCAVARALDVVGERWTLLILRDLLIGARRYTDLLDGLPGIGPNLLADRLKALQTANLVRRTKLPPPASSSVYELTPLGRGLEPALFELARWGISFMQQPCGDDVFRFEWMLGAMRAAGRPEAARGVHDTYEFRIEDDVLHARIDNGEIGLELGPARDPDLVIEADLETMVAIGSRRLGLEDAIREGRLTVAGDPGAAGRVAAIFVPLSPAATPVAV